tara:strand:+ start:120 stop:506 length:387 start_codon:yes stop_codon:yes gene_type:complete
MMMVVTPQMMAAMQRGGGGRGMMGAGRGRGRGRGANVWTPDGAGGEGAGAAGGERKTPTKGPLSKTWVRPGAEIAGDDGAAAGAGGGINAPCTFFARGKARSDSHWSPYTTAFAWCTPFLEDFLSRRL